MSSHFAVATPIGYRPEKLGITPDSPLLSGLSNLDRAEILAKGHRKTFERGHILFMEGDQVNSVYLLLSGFIRLGLSSRTGSEVTISLAGKNEFVGALDLYSRSKHSSFGEALRSSTVLVWDANSFDTFLRRSPALQQNAARQLTVRLREIQERFLEVSTEKVAARIANQLLRLSKQIGQRTSEGIEIRLSRAELAEMTGTTLFTVSRILCDWESKQLLFAARQSIVLQPKFHDRTEFEQIRASMD